MKRNVGAARVMIVIGALCVLYSLFTNLHGVWSTWPGVLPPIIRALEAMTSPIALVGFLCFWAAYRISVKDSAETKMRERSWLVTTLVCILVVTGFVLFEVTSRKNSLQERESPSSTQTSASHEKRPLSGLKPDALKNWAVTKSAGGSVTNEHGTLTPAMKKRLRETVALSLKGGLEYSNSPLKVELQGDDHNALVFRASGMNETIVSNLLKAIPEYDKDFWNRVRLAAFKEINFSGNGFGKTIREAEVYPVESWL